MEREQLIRLVTGAQKGDHTAMDELFAAFYNDVYYFALKTVKDSDLACDITQETFLEVINTIGSLKEPAAFVTWMKQITYHQCTRYFKKKKDVLVEEDEEGNTIFDTLADESEGSIPSEVYEKAEFRETIMNMINDLTEEQRSAVMMYYFDELPVGQIAQIQGVSEGTVKSRLNYARKGMKKSVEDYEKKHNIRLHSFSFLPLFMLFFGKELMPAAKAAQVGAVVSKAAASAGAAAGGTAAAASAEGAGTAGAAVTAKSAAGAIVTKIVAGVAAAAVLVGGGAYAAKQVLHGDKDRDCICDFCGNDYHHGAYDDETGHDRGICTECGFYVGVHDTNDDSLCDECGEYFCGPSHLNEHSYVDGVCEFCGTEIHLDADDNGLCDYCEEAMCAMELAEHKRSDRDACDICEMVLECIDENYDCTCDVCTAGYHRINGEKYMGRVAHDARCDQCGIDLGFWDENMDGICDDCGEFPCGAFHGNGHFTDDSGVCNWCGNTVVM